MGTTNTTADLDLAQRILDVKRWFTERKIHSYVQFTKVFFPEFEDETMAVKLRNVWAGRTRDEYCTSILEQVIDKLEKEQ